MIRNSTARQQTATIEGNIVISEVAAADLRNVNITGNLRLDRMGLVELRDTTTFNGDTRVGTRALLDYKNGSQTGSVVCFNDGAVRSVPGSVTVDPGCVVY